MRYWASLLFDRITHDALLLAIPLAIFLGIAFVVGLLALGERNARFYQMALPIQLSAHAGLPFL